MPTPMLQKLALMLHKGGNHKREIAIHEEMQRCSRHDNFVSVSGAISLRRFAPLDNAISEGLANKTVLSNGVCGEAYGCGLRTNFSRLFSFGKEPFLAFFSSTGE